MFKQTGKQFELAGVRVVHKSAGANVTLKIVESESVSQAKWPKKSKNAIPSLPNKAITILIMKKGLNLTCTMAKRNNEGGRHYFLERKKTLVKILVLNITFSFKTTQPSKPRSIPEAICRF